MRVSAAVNECSTPQQGRDLVRSGHDVPVADPESGGLELPNSLQRSQQPR